MSGLIEHLRADYWPTLQVIWPALLAAVALAIAAGMTGVFVILRRETLVALSLPQIVMLGAALGLRLDWPGLGPALLTVAVALGMIAWSRRREAGHLLLPALYVAGICLSILLIANAGAHLAEVQNLLIGIDVAVAPREAITIALVVLAAAGVCAALWRRWLLLAQAPAVAELAGLHPLKWDALFLLLLAAVLVPATSAVGTVMVVALLFLPVATILPWTARIPQSLLAAAVAGVVCVLAGLVLSVEMGWPLSHSVGGAGFGLFLVSHVMAQFIR